MRERRIRIRRGLDLPVPGAPAPVVEAATLPREVALLGDDCPKVRPDLKVRAGDRVAMGQTLFVDRALPELRFVSPVAGVVKAVHRGEMRRLEAVVVESSGDAAVEHVPLAPRGVLPLARDAVVARLLEAGAWPALRQRPFGGIADPARVPAAVFVRAVHTDPLAAEAALALRGREADLGVGLAALAQLTEGPVFLCAAPGALPALPDFPGRDRLRVVRFSGPHPAGLVGTHVHHLFPVGAERRIWYTGAQDALAIGHLLRTGRIDPERVVALGGPAAHRPRLLRTRLGASTEGLVRGDLQEEPCVILSGSVLSGRRAASRGGFLGRHHEQVSVLPAGEEDERRGWLLPRLRRGMRVPFWRPAPTWRQPARSASPGMLPLEAFDRVVPLRLPVGLLLRALAAGDTEAARGFGALQLEEEDLALCSYLCPARLRYGQLLRAVLDTLEAELP